MEQHGGGGGWGGVGGGGTLQTLELWSRQSERQSRG